MTFFQKSLLTILTVAAAWLPGSASANCVLGINAAGQALMQGKPIAISVQIPTSAYPDPDWLVRTHRVPAPDSTLPASVGRTPLGMITLRGLPDARSLHRSAGIVRVDMLGFTIKSRTYYRVKMTTERFVMLDTHKRTFTAIMVVNMTTYGGVRYFHLKLWNADTGAEVYQSGLHYPDSSWMPFVQSSGWISIAPLPSP